MSKTPDVLWVCFDLDNKDGKQYLWWFPSRAAARKHRKEQHARRHGARLSPPQCWMQLTHVRA